MNTRQQERSLRLTEEEATELLYLLVASQTELSPTQHNVLEKLGDCCRDFLRERQHTNLTPEQPPASSCHHTSQREI